MAIAGHQVAERDRRRTERHLSEARLFPGKALENFDFEAVPMISKAQITALYAWDVWLEKGANLILSGPSAGENLTCVSAIGLALVEKGWIRSHLKPQNSRDRAVQLQDGFGRVFKQVGVSCKSTRNGASS